jgi:oligopeptidase B
MPNNLDPHSGVRPPVAATLPGPELPGSTIADEYAWMRSDPERLGERLRIERESYDRATSHLENLRAELFSEVEQRLLPTDESVSWRHGDLFYYMKSVTGSEHQEFTSTRNQGETGQVILAEATLANEPGGFIAIELLEPSPDNRLLAYSFDTRGDEVYTLRFREIATGRDLPDSVARSYEGGAWSSDSSTFFYAVHDDLYRPYQVWRHKIGTDSSEDVLVLTEDDQRFAVTVTASRDGTMIFIQANSRDTSETWYVPADSPETAPAVIRPRRKDVEYRVERDGGDFLVITNDGAPEFRFVRAPLADPGRWTVAAEARPGERLYAVHPLAGHLVFELRRDGFPLLRVVDKGTGAEWEIAADIPAGQVSLLPRFEYHATAVTVEIQSIVAPAVWYDVDLHTRTRTLRKRQEVPGYDPAAYRTERRHAPAADGALVPFDIAYRCDTPLDGTAPALLWGYGAYESCDDPAFDPGLISLLDRGVVYVLTHPRGGGENGRNWWLGGRLEHKSRTFTDHVAVANHLCGMPPDADGGSSADAVVDGARIATRGLSAGGLLQAAALNAAPRRWAAVVAEVPFVDVIGSMLDPGIPLTVNEWDEWGDPRRPEDFAWMVAYSPYDNMPRGPRPPIMVTAAVHDARVLVHEPAKWVARLRDSAQPGDETVFRVELGAGSHTGPAGRYAHYRYEAEVYAYILDKLRVTR